MPTLIKRPQLQIDYFDHGADTLIFTFTNWGSHLPLEGTGFCGDWLLNRFDVVSFKSSRNYWFQDVTHKDLALIRSAIRTYSARAGFGSSMGGYAALQFSAALGMTRVLALSPQFDPRGDARYERDVAEIAFAHSIEAGSLSPGQYTVVFDPKGPDLAHVEALEALTPVQRIAIPYGGHPISFLLADLGILQPFVTAILAGTITDLHFEKRRSKAYLHNLAMHAAKHHPMIALDLIDRAIAMSDGLFYLHRLRGDILLRLGRKQDALNAVERAISLAPHVSELQLFHQHVARLQAA